MIFIDSNVWIALYNNEGTLHNRAVNYITQFDTSRVTLIINNLIFAEIITVLSQKRGRKTATEAGFQILQHPFVQLKYVNEYTHAQAWSIFQNIHKKNVSFADCSILATMDSEDVNTLATFDTTDFKPLQKQFRFKLLEPKA